MGRARFSSAFIVTPPKESFMLIKNVLCLEEVNNTYENSNDVISGTLLGIILEILNANTQRFK